MPDRRWIAYELHSGLLQWVLGARIPSPANALAAEEMKAHNGRSTAAAWLVAVQAPFSSETAEEGRQLIQFVERTKADRRVNAVAIQARCLAMSMHPSTAAHTGSSRVRFEPPERSGELTPRKAWSIMRIVQQA
ncbi:MAG: hypothetical protein U0892_05110 [Pirellulales bacterium]